MSNRLHWAKVDVDRCGQLCSKYMGLESGKTFHRLFSFWLTVHVATAGATERHLTSFGPRWVPFAVNDPALCPYLSLPFFHSRILAQRHLSKMSISEGRLPAIRVCSFQKTLTYLTQAVVSTDSQFITRPQPPDMTAARCIFA
jgi:hypothetical protein